VRITAEGPGACLSLLKVFQHKRTVFNCVWRVCLLFDLPDACKCCLKQPMRKIDELMSKKWCMIKKDNEDVLRGIGKKVFCGFENKKISK